MGWSWCFLSAGDCSRTRKSRACKDGSLLAAYLGRFDEAVQLHRRAFDLDPLNAAGWDGLAEAKFYMGQLDEAATDSKKALEMNPDVWPGPILLSRIYMMQGRPQDALAAIELVRFDGPRVWLHAIAYHMLGREKDRTPH